jgi:hypothetical protein
LSSGRTRGQVEIGDDTLDLVELGQVGHVDRLIPEHAVDRKHLEVHQDGGYGSTGYRYPFSREETSKLVLRTHTTSDPLAIAGSARSKKSC